MTANLKELQAAVEAAQDPAEKLELLDEVAAHFYDADDYQTAISFYEQAEPLAEEGNQRAHYVGQKGVCHYLLHNDKEAHQALTAARKMFQPENEDFNPELYGLVHYFLGSLFEYNNDNDASLENRLIALSYLDHLDREAQAMLLYGMSRNYEELGEFRKAVKFNTQAISLISDNDPEVAYMFESLGFSHYELGEYDKALGYFSQVLEAAPDFERKNDIYFNIGLCYRRLLNFQMALSTYMKMLELKELGQGSSSLSWIYLEIAHCHYQLKDHQESLEFVEKALGESLEDDQERAEVQSYLTNNYYALGRFEEAVQAGEKALEISEKFHNVELMLPNLALSCYQLGQKEKFQYYRDWCNRSFPDLSWTKQLNKLDAN